jgi:hypothetical protein
MTSTQVGRYGTFRGPARDVAAIEGCTNVEIRGNLTAE